MLGGVERIVERPAALWTRLNGHAQSQRIVGDGRAPGQYRLNNRALPIRNAYFKGSHSRVAVYRTTCYVWRSREGWWRVCQGRPLARLVSSLKRGLAV